MDNTDENDEKGATAEFERRVRAAADEAARKAVGDRFPHDPDAPVVRDGLVRDLVREYRDEWLGHLAVVTHKTYTIHLNWFVARFGPQAVREVRARDVERKADAMGWADGTRRLVLAVCQGFFRWAGRASFRMALPAGESRGEEVVITPAEADALVARAQGDFRALLELMRYSWCRPGEARTLTVEMVNWAAGTVTLAKHKTKKKGKQRIIYLTPNAVAVLTRQRDRHGTGLLFRTGAGRAFTTQNINQRMRRLRKRCGLRSEVVAYSFRHTGATRALEHGVPDSDVSALLGHTGTAMLTRHYSHVSANAQRLKGVAARMDGKA